MLGPKEKPEWGGFLLKYYHDAYEFFEDELEPANIKEVRLCFHDDSRLRVARLTKLLLTGRLKVRARAN